MRSGELGRRKYKEICPTCLGAERVLNPCPACEGTGYERLRCRSCYKWKSPGEFLRGGRVVRWCADCRREGFTDKSPIYRGGSLLVRWSERSSNRKTGPIPVSATSPRTCPPGCPWLGAGCYGEQDFSGLHWRRLAAGRGITWEDFCSRVAALPEGQMWRHNEAGDLPGDGDLVDADLLCELVDASRGREGFTYTHKPVLGSDMRSAHNVALISQTNVVGGLTINLSGDGLEHADSLSDLEIAPVVVVLPEGSPAVTTTPAGRKVVACPALRDDEVSCLTCRLCARPDRDFLVGFPAHGNLRKRMSQWLVQLRLF